MSDEQSVEAYVLRLLDECRDEIKLSDSKASLIFAGVSAATAFLLTVLADDTTALRASGTAVAVLSLLALAGFFASIVMLGLAVIPRLGHAESGKARYFEEQALFSTPQALLDALTAEAGQSLERHAQQLLFLSRSARRKYRHLRRAMFTVCVAAMVLGAAIVASAAR